MTAPGCGASPGLVARSAMLPALVSVIVAIPFAPEGTAVAPAPETVAPSTACGAPWPSSGKVPAGV
jgi:hypothetical protein